MKYFGSFFLQSLRFKYLNILASCLSWIIKSLIRIDFLISMTIAFSFSITFSLKFLKIIMLFKSLSILLFSPLINFSIPSFKLTSSTLIFKPLCSVKIASISFEYLLRMEKHINSLFPMTS